MRHSENRHSRFFQLSFRLAVDDSLFRTQSTVPRNMLLGVLVEAVPSQHLSQKGAFAKACEANLSIK